MSRYTFMFRLRYKTRSKGGLPFSDIHEDRVDIEIEVGRQFTSGPMNFRHYRVFPHG